MNIGDNCIHTLLQFCDIYPKIGDTKTDVGARVFQFEGEGTGKNSFLLFVHQIFLHPAAFSLAKDHAEHFHGIKIFGALCRNMVGKYNRRQLHIVIDRVPTNFGDSRLLRKSALNLSLSLGNVFKVNIYQFFSLFNINITSNTQYCIIRSVKIFVKRLVINLFCCI